MDHCALIERAKIFYFPKFRVLFLFFACSSFDRFTSKQFFYFKTFSCITHLKFRFPFHSFSFNHGFSFTFKLSHISTSKLCFFSFTFRFPFILSVVAPYLFYFGIPFPQTFSFQFIKTYFRQMC